MRIRFCAAQTYGLNPDEEYADVYAEFEVAEAPTKEQCEAIQESLNDAYDKWYEKVINQEAAYYNLCKKVCRKHGVKIVKDKIVTTFYV